MARKKLSFTSRYVFSFGLLMLLANTLIGIVILVQSTSSFKSLINNNMLDVVKSAAGLLDGDALGALTEADVDGPVFRDIEDQLSVFQKHVDIQFIYAVKQVGENQFVFTVDPDPVDPGAFGEEIVVTEALVKAGNGEAAVDSVTMEDRWGNFYSAYCPVFDSAGKVAGIVGIDFDAGWYEATLRRHTISIAVITCLSVLIGGSLVFVITHNVRKRFRILETQLSALSDGMDQLIAETGGAAFLTNKKTDGNAPDPRAAEGTDDEIEKLSMKIQSMQKDLNVYERLQKDQYYTDAVTGLPNLNFVRQFADERVNLLRASHAEPAVVYFDIRDMVSYNTEYGYSRGDELLRLTAKTIREAFPDAMTCRGEGDHFIVIRGFEDAVEEKAKQINETVRKEAYGHSTGIQCAVVQIADGMTAAEALQRARSVLKRIGDNLNVVCRFYSEEEDSEYQMNQMIVQSFDEAMRLGRIKVYYQRIVETGSQQVARMEALARWVDPERGFISPGQFIPVLSRYHLLHKLDLYMVEQICREYPLREKGGLAGIPVSINFSARDFDYTNVAEALNRTLERYGVPRSAVIVEITEQDLAQATDAFIGQMRRIHENGYRLWLDDFGSGYSSLSALGQYHIDRIKFDMELIRHLDDHNGVNRIIMESVTDMCRRMGVHTLAEGVENEEQVQFLRKIGCEMIQGFYFFRPEPLEKIVNGAGE